jgi:hypothetical protein
LIVVDDGELIDLQIVLTLSLASAFYMALKIKLYLPDISSFYELVGASDLGVAKVKFLQISFPFSQHQMISHFH